MFLHYTNGIAERKNGHLQDVVWTLFIESSVPSRFWVGALFRVMRLINRLPTPKLQNQSPYFQLHAVHPTYHYLRTCGCVCFVYLLLLAHERNKLSAQSVKCAFLGYASHQKGYLCYDPTIHCIHTPSKVKKNLKHIFLSGSY